MGNILSPSINIYERDYSTTVPALPTTVTALVGEFKWGPCNQIMSIGDDRELVDLVGEPDDTNYASFFSAWNFLQYANALRLVRVINETTAKNAGLELADDTASGTTALADLILNDEDADDYVPTFGADAKLQFFAKYPGARGNDIKVAVANATDFATANIVTGTTFASVFDYSPATGEIAVVVLVDDEIEETYIVSLSATATDYEGNNNYVEQYINRRSSWILVYDDSSNTDIPDSIEATALTGGVGASPSTSEVTAGYDLFDNAEETDINMVIDGANTNVTVQQYIIDNILETRKDCVGYLTVEKAAVVGVANISTAVANCITYRSTTLARSTSYAALYGNWKYQYDQYNDKYRWVPLSGDMAGITANLHYNRDPWFAPMGYNYGLLKNVSKLAFNPKRSHRDSLYRDFVNPVTKDRDAGFVVLGQKTLESAPSSFSRLDVRWLFVTIERAIGAAAKYFLGEKNTIFTRRQFVNVVSPYLRDVQGREGIEVSETGDDGFFVQCDETNNTDEVRARNEFVAEIYIRPTKTAEFIKIYFTNVKGSVSFEEVIKKTGA